MQDALYLLPLVVISAFPYSYIEVLSHLFPDSDDLERHA
jgi:hypothetical protein